MLETDALLRTLIDQINVGIFTVGADHAILQWNRFMEVRSGRPGAAVLGRDLFACFPELPRAWLAHKLRAVFLLKSFAFVSFRQRPYLFRFRHGHPLTGGFDWMRQDLTLMPVVDARGEVQAVCSFLFDVTAEGLAERKAAEAEARLAEALSSVHQTVFDLESERAFREAMNRQLMDVSRQAGMAEVASGVLHNLGNALNSLNVSADLAENEVRGMKISGLFNALRLIEQHRDDLPAFFGGQKGQQLIAYLHGLAGHLAEGQRKAMHELGGVGEVLERIKRLMSTHQGTARSPRLIEPTRVTELLEAALADSAAAAGPGAPPIEVVRDYADIAPVLTERHKVGRILGELLSNARQALAAVESGRRQIILRARQGPGPEVCIEVADNGIGIPEENLTRIFAHNFSGKETGRGCGLNASALLAKELGGSLTCRSEGAGRGATFTLVLPLDTSSVGDYVVG